MLTVAFNVIGSARFDRVGHGQRLTLVGALTVLGVIVTTDGAETLLASVLGGGARTPPRSVRDRPLFSMFVERAASLVFLLSHWTVFRRVGSGESDEELHLAADGLDGGGVHLVCRYPAFFTVTSNGTC